MTILHKLIIPPDTDSYAFTDGNEVLNVQLDGGAGRYRKDILDSNNRMSVQWTLNREEYNYIRMFFIWLIEHGALPFTVDLYVDDPFDLTENEVHFIPGTFGLKSQVGDRFIVGGTLEVKPVEMEQEKLDWAMAYALFGNEWAYYFDLFDQIINVMIPAIGIPSSI